ncbi:hypothetical protein N657DRAFT_650160 [Parathielavia appendiculata]|uniref:Nudix hydrolase domain-containing protein n=1 Tax=Parathielavia appendiculata TaxID=2587402 RepID=A0AAN6TSZ6_9PEZI|nr:hypothetical protein N657DRAFT_650160 [Parathielavia appendiculata]
MSTTALNVSTFSPALSPYNILPDEYLTAHPTLKGLIVSGVVLHANRVLLIQRAPHDGFPLKWECPGGGVDQTDATILYALCREVHEETGLEVRHITNFVDVRDFEGVGNTLWRTVTFLVVLDLGEVPVVRLNPDEHVDAVWAAEEEVLLGRAQGRELDFAYDGQRQTVLGLLRRSGDHELVELTKAGSLQKNA